MLGLVRVISLLANVSVLLLVHTAEPNEMYDSLALKGHYLLEKSNLSETLVPFVVT